MRKFFSAFKNILFIFALLHWVIFAALVNTAFVHMPGNITLGGMFPIHSMNEKGECVSLNGVLGIQRLEAMLYAVKQINKNESILPGITLGVSAFDTCSSETTALDLTVEKFVIDHKCHMQDEMTYGGRQVMGVVGPLYSSISVQVAHLFRLFKIPQISYDSTSPELSDKTKYKYFLRTVPSDIFQVRAIVDLLLHYGWSYVSVVYSEDNYGLKGMEGLSMEAKQKGICIAMREKVRVRAGNLTYARIIQKLIQEKEARVVIVLCSKKTMIEYIFRAAHKQNAIREFQWIGSDAFVTVNWPKELRPHIRGLITLRPQSSLSAGFREYFYNRVPIKDDANPWFTKYFMKTLGCRPLSRRSTKRLCTADDTLRSANVTIEEGVQRTIDAVYAFAQALDKISKRKCKNFPTICDKLKKSSGEEVLNALKTNAFPSINGRDIIFNKDGDVRDAKYFIYCYDKNGSRDYANMLIGKWENNILTLKKIMENIFGRLEKSSCGKKCKGNEVQIRIEGKPSCCWGCTVCTGNKYAFNKTFCKSCERGFWPDSKRQRCISLPSRHFTLNIDFVELYLVLPPLVVSTLGFLSVLCIIVVFVKHNQTPLVKASGRELSYLLLTGLFFCYAILVVNLMKPSPYVCAVEFILDSLPFTICYAAVIVKTNRISRIFNRRNLTKRPLFIHPQSQICFSFALVAVQIMLLSAFFLLRLPKEKTLYLSDSDLVLMCDISDKDFLLSQIYNFVLIIVCTYYAFKTRRSPMNFNEAKYIAFAMYCTCVLWLAFITVYLVQTDVMLKSCIRCLSISLIATILLACLFVPKVYIIIFKPSENRKRPTLPSHSISSLNCDQTAGSRAHAQQAADTGGVSLLEKSPENGTFPRRPNRKKRDPDKITWRYSLPLDQYSQSNEPRKIDREKELELEMKALIERLAILESLLHHQRQTTRTYQAQEVEDAGKTCESPSACLPTEDRALDECTHTQQSSNTGKMDNRSLLMTYAQTTNAEQNPRDSTSTYVTRSGKTLIVPHRKELYSKKDTSENDKVGQLQYSISPVNRKSASEA